MATVQMYSPKKESPYNKWQYPKGKVQRRNVLITNGNSQKETSKEGKSL